MTENYLTQIEQLKNLIEKQTIALEEKDKQNLVFSKKYELFSSDFANISNENIQIKSELTYLKTQLENYIKLNNKKEYSFEALGEKQTDKEGFF